MIEEHAAHVEKYSYEASHIIASTEHLKDELDLLVVVTGGWSLPMYKDDTHALYLDVILQNYVQVCESGFRPTVVLATYDSIDLTWINQVIDANSRFCYRIHKKVEVLVESFPFNVPRGFGTAGDLAIRHREIFVRELQNFDLFVSQENDVKLTDRNLHYFVSAYRDLMLQTGLKFHPALFVYEKLNGHRYADWCLRYGKIIRIGMPVEPGNLILLAEVEISKKQISIIGMPGCARSKKENGVDWILWRILCDIKISTDDINHLGNGGLL